MNACKWWFALFNINQNEIQSTSSLSHAAETNVEKHPAREKSQHEVEMYSFRGKANKHWLSLHTHIILRETINQNYRKDFRNSNSLINCDKKSTSRLFKWHGFIWSKQIYRNSNQCHLSSHIVSTLFWPRIAVRATQRFTNGNDDDSRCEQSSISRIYQQQNKRQRAKILDMKMLTLSLFAFCRNVWNRTIMTRANGVAKILFFIKFREVENIFSNA